MLRFQGSEATKRASVASTNQAASAESLQHQTPSLENLLARSKIFDDHIPEVVSDDIPAIESQRTTGRSFHFFKGNNRFSACGITACLLLLYSTRQQNEAYSFRMLYFTVGLQSELDCPFTPPSISVKFSLMLSSFSVFSSVL